MVPASLKGKYVIRFTVTSQYTTDQDIERDWKIISDTATKVSLTPVTKIWPKFNCMYTDFKIVICSDKKIVWNQGGKSSSFLNQFHTSV